jgi:hypothetical protein
MKPLYEQLHCYVRAKLHEHYGAASTLASRSNQFAFMA